MALATLLDRHRNELIETWIELKRQLPHPRYRGQPTAQLRAVTTRQLGAVIEMATVGAQSLSESFLAGICHIYQQADLSATVDACLLLKEAALPVIRRELAAEPEAAWVALTQLDSCLRWIVEQHIHFYEIDVKQRLQDQQDRTTLFAEIIQSSAFLPNDDGPEPTHTNSREKLSLRTLAALEERERLARELHDNLAQTLGILKMRLTIADDLLAGAQVDPLHNTLREMKEIAAAAYTDAREAIFSLRTPTEAGADFLPSLAQYLSRYRASYGVHAELVAADSSADQLTGEKATQITRIIQEALTNIRKHANARRAWVRLIPEGDGVCIIVEDDGEGFNVAQPLLDSTYGFGLRVMRERAESVGGKLDIDAHRGRGTRILLWVPLTEANNDQTAPHFTSR